jgi:cobalt-zinc-cadmium efflux system outer membrane protein
LAEATIDAARATLYAELRSTFVTALAAESKLTLAQSALRLAERSARTIDRQIAAGELARVAAARAGVEVANARMALTRARADWTLAGKRLANLANRPDGLISADGSLEVLSALPSLPVLQEQLTNAPALRLAREETARRQAEVAVEVSRKVGNLTFSAGVKYLEQTDEPAGVLAMSLPLPLSDRNQGNVVRAHGAVAQAAAQEHATELALRGELRDLYLRYETAIATADEVRGAILPAATAALSSTEQGFKLGKFGLVDVLDTRRTLLQARLQLVDALTEAQVAQAGTIRILGIAAGDASPRSEERR